MSALATRKQSVKKEELMKKITEIEETLKQIYYQKDLLRDNSDSLARKLNMYEDAQRPKRYGSSYWKSLQRDIDRVNEEIRQNTNQRFNLLRKEDEQKKKLNELKRMLHGAGSAHKVSKSGDVQMSGTLIF